MRGYTLGWLGAIIVVGLGTIAVVAVIAAGGGRSERASRALLVRITGRRRSTAKPRLGDSRRPMPTH